MKEIAKIVLSWRKAPGSRRHLVGTIRRNVSEGVRFSYDVKAVKEAQKDGFLPYKEFSDITKEYSDNVLDVFGQRLMKLDRPDIREFYKFWEIDEKYANDKFYMLAYTQGIVPTDNFEFLADFHPIKELCFLTDLASVSRNKIDSGQISEGDVLRFEHEKRNEYDPKAIKIFKGDLFVGYIKKVHNLLFTKEDSENLKLEVKALDKNGIIKTIFVRVYYDN